MTYSKFYKLLDEITRLHTRTIRGRGKGSDNDKLESNLDPQRGKAEDDTKGGKDDDENQLDNDAATTVGDIGHTFDYLDEDASVGSIYDFIDIVGNEIDQFLDDESQVEEAIQIVKQDVRKHMKNLDEEQKFDLEEKLIGFEDERLENLTEKSRKQQRKMTPKEKAKFERDNEAYIREQEKKQKERYQSQDLERIDYTKKYFTLSDEIKKLETEINKKENKISEKEIIKLKKELERDKDILKQQTTSKELAKKLEQRAKARFKEAKQTGKHIREDKTYQIDYDSYVDDIISEFRLLDYNDEQIKNIFEKRISNKILLPDPYKFSWASVKEELMNRIAKRRAKIEKTRERLISIRRSLEIYIQKRQLKELQKIINESELLEFDNIEYELEEMFKEFGEILIDGLKRQATIADTVADYETIDPTEDIETMNKIEKEFEEVKKEFDDFDEEYDVTGSIDAFNTAKSRGPVNSNIRTRAQIRLLLLQMFYKDLLKKIENKPALLARLKKYVISKGYLTKTASLHPLKTAGKSYTEPAKKIYDKYKNPPPVSTATATTSTQKADIALIRKDEKLNELFNNLIASGSNTANAIKEVLKEFYKITQEPLNISGVEKLYIDDPTDFETVDEWVRNRSLNIDTRGLPKDIIEAINNANRGLATMFDADLTDTDTEDNKDLTSQILNRDNRRNKDKILNAMKSAEIGNIKIIDIWKKRRKDKIDELNDKIKDSKTSDEDRTKYEHRLNEFTGSSDDENLRNFIFHDVYGIFSPGKYLEYVLLVKEYVKKLFGYDDSQDPQVVVTDDVLERYNIPMSNQFCIDCVDPYYHTFIECKDYSRSALPYRRMYNANIKLKKSYYWDLVEGNEGLNVLIKKHSKVKTQKELDDIENKMRNILAIIAAKEDTKLYNTEYAKKGFDTSFYKNRQYFGVGITSAKFQLFGPLPSYDGATTQRQYDLVRSHQGSKFPPVIETGRVITDIDFSKSKGSDTNINNAKTALGLDRSSRYYFLVSFSDGHIGVMDYTNLQEFINIGNSVDILQYLKATCPFDAKSKFDYKGILFPPEFFKRPK
jgi:hypothetical protein